MAGPSTGCPKLDPGSHERKRRALRAPSLQTGFVYVELLVAMLIMSFVLLALGPLFLLSARNNASAGDLTFAATLVQARIAEINTTDFDELEPGIYDETVEMRDITYERRVIVEADAPHPGMKTISIRVRGVRQQNAGPSSVARVSYYRVP